MDAINETSDEEWHFRYIPGAKPVEIATEDSV
jgi:hypothetical protein